MLLDFLKNYRQRSFGEQNRLVNQKELRVQRLNDQRHNRRNELFSASRGKLQGDAQKTFKKQEAENVAGDRLKTLAKWREERNRRKLLEKSRARPPFKVGIVRHRWYSPPVIKDEIMKKKQKHEIIKNKKNKVIKKVPPSSTDHQFQAPTASDAISPVINKQKIAKKRNEKKNYLQNTYINGSIIPFLPKAFDTSTPIKTETDSYTDINGISLEQLQEEEEEECKTEYCKYLLDEETERLIRLCLEQSEKNAISKRDIYHLIEDCHAQFMELEELESNN